MAKQTKKIKRDIVHGNVDLPDGFDDPRNHKLHITLVIDGDIHDELEKRAHGDHNSDAYRNLMNGILREALFNTKADFKGFEPGQAIVFEPTWAKKKIKGAVAYKGHPLRYGAIVHFLAYHKPAIGHCIVTTYEGRVITMLHPDDFRMATDEEV